MPTLIVLFRLKPGVDRQQYEQWARGTDLPIVRRRRPAARRPGAR